MKASVYNQQGEESGTTLLPKEIFDIKMNPDMVFQVAVSQMGNRRRVMAHTKNRGEVSGGGKKPWRQKGTGRARHGSIRSPIWRHGGVALGPRKDRVFARKINEKMRRKAIFMILSEKAKNNLLITIEDLNLEKIKTKLMAEFLKKLPLKNQSAMLILPQIDKSVILAARNIPKIRVLQARDLNCLDLISYEYVILSKSAVKVIKETFAK